MYNEFFGLQKSPFNLTPDPEFLYLTAQHRDALAGLTYAIMARKGFVVLTGDAGTGKTTLLTRILEHLPVARVQSSVIVNPTLTPTEFLEATLLDFGFSEIPSSKAQQIVAFQNFLWKGHREGKTSALVVDEAHKLSADVLEEIRLLGNFETREGKLLQIALVGQSELDDLLNREDLRQFKQRVAMRLTIEPLPAADVNRYIAFRWLKAGGERAPFTADAFACISEVSQGVPRIINVICDNALMEAFGEKSAQVEVGHVLGVCRRLHLACSAPRNSPVEAALQPVEALPLKPATDDYPMKTLERYGTVRPSLLARLAGKFGLRQGIETA
jgi:general secretion pathway protein A